MSVLSFLEKILPTTDRRTLERTIENQRNCLSRETLPAASALVDLINAEWKFKDPNVVTLNSYFMKTVDAKKINYKWRGANLVMYVNHTLVMLEANLSIIQDLIPKVFKSETIATNMISYNKASLLQYVDAATFAIRYGRCLLNYVSSVELASVQNVKNAGGVGPNDLKFLLDRRFDFAALMPALCLDVAKTKDNIKQATDMLITPSSDESANIIVGKDKTDPFGFSSLPFPMSFIYRMRLNKVDKQIDEFEGAKEEARAIEYRIILLKEHIENGHGDAVTEKSLEVNEDRLMKVKRRIEQWETDYELN